MKRTITRFAFVGLFALVSILSTFAQTIVTGKVVDKDSKDPLPGASITVGEGTNLKGTTADADGRFSLWLSPTSTITFRSVGYKTQTKTLRNAGPSVDLGVIEMESEAIAMQAVSVVASIVPKDRLTPIPVTNIRASDIAAKTMNTEFPELMKSAPSVYVSRTGGGFGDSRITLRGFDTQNIGVLINGIPVNDMENGRVYWSNWAGLTDVSSFIQIQRGLGASRLGISSVGGTINIITKSTDAQRGGNVSMGVANDGYMKYGFSVSTGLLDNGWALTLSGSTSYGDGYVRGTDFRGYNYFLNLSKKINDAHTVSFTAFGAPQWHNQRKYGTLADEYDRDADGIRMNCEFGYHNGKVLSPSYNYYHKPQLSLNHYWTINDQSSLSTSVYASVSSGGGRSLDGLVEEVDKKKVYWTNLIGLDANGLPYEMGARTPEGLIDYNAIYGINAANGEGGSKVVFVNSVNRHNWYGLLSTYRNRISDRFVLTGGFDGRYYRGYHYKEIGDLLGGKYFRGKPLYAKKPEDVKKDLVVGDKYSYDNIGEVIWSGLFAQGEYTYESISAFLSGSLTYEGYRYHNPGGAPLSLIDGKYVKDDVNGKQVSDFVNFVPVSIKAGVSYKFGENSNAFANAGFFTRAPNFGGSFLNYGIEINQQRAYEKILTFELGYGFHNGIVDFDINGYYTAWNDRFVRRNGVGNERNFTYNFRGLNATHMGVEMETSVRPINVLEIRGMASIGNWRWKGNAKFDVYDGDQNLVRADEIKLDNVHVGNAAQLTFALGAKWEMVKGFRVGADLNFFGNNYADFDPSNRISVDKNGVRNDYVKDSWKMPNYALLDLNASYRFEIGGMNASVFGGVNNLLDNKYISDAREQIGRKGNEVINDRRTNTVFYGFGRTWQLGMRVTF